VKSPQQIMGSIVKYYLGQKLNIPPDQIYHVTLMPCFDKKLEASREDFYSDVTSSRDVDCVITTVEIEDMLDKHDVCVATGEKRPLDSVLESLSCSLVANPGSGSGGYAENVLRYVMQHVLNQPVQSLVFEAQKNPDLREVRVANETGDTVFKFAIANGFRNIQNLVQKMKRKRCDYDLVEVMACPSGCLNGGAQLRHIHLIQQPY
jgi:iron only hydrogenase large subunit-like protein